MVKLNGSLYPLAFGVSNQQRNTAPSSTPVPLLLSLHLVQLKHCCKARIQGSKIWWDRQTSRSGWGKVAVLIDCLKDGDFMWFLWLDDELGRIRTSNMQDIARVSNPFPNGSALPTDIQDAGVVMHHAIAQPTSPRRTQELCGGLRHLGVAKCRIWLVLVVCDTGPERLFILKHRKVFSNTVYTFTTRAELARSFAKDFFITALWSSKEDIDVCLMCVDAVDAKKDSNIYYGRIFTTTCEKLSMVLSR